MGDDLEIAVDFEAGLVRVRPKTLLARRYSVTSRVDDFDVQLDVKTQDDGSPRCVGVSVSVADDVKTRPAVTSSVLVRVPVRDLLARARRSSLIVFRDDDLVEDRKVTGNVTGQVTGNVLERVQGQRSRLDDQLARSRDQLEELEDLMDRVQEPEDDFGIRESKPGRGRPLSDDHLRRVAKTYRAAVRDGQHPVGRVAYVAQVARQTAYGWISKARQRGLLGATRPGVAGEIDGQ